jgi:hypothetical protein
MARRTFLMGSALTACLILTSTSLHAGNYAKITIDDLYDDWAGIPVVDSDAGDNSGGPDIGDTQIANDGKNLYIRNTFPNSLTLTTYIAIDTDLNASTGYDIFGLGIIGTEAGWANDFGFSQSTGNWNNGLPLGGEYFGGGHALLSFWGNTSQRELAISLANTNNGGLPTFPGDTVRLIIFTDSGAGADGLPAGFPGDSGINGDITAVIDYTLAVPEPHSLFLLTMAGFGLLVRRRS